MNKFFSHLLISLATSVLVFGCLAATAQTQYCAYQSHIDDTSWTLCFDTVSETGYFIFNVDNDIVEQFNVTINSTPSGFEFDGVCSNGRITQRFVYMYTEGDTAVYAYEYDDQLYYAQFSAFSK